MVKVEYANAYKEVLDILKYVPKEDYEKIPKKKIEMFSKCANYDHFFEYNPDITLEEQNVSDIAQTIIAILFRDYWATNEQREKIIAKENYDMELLEKEKEEKYNPENLFKNNKEIIKENKIESAEKSLVKVSIIKWYKRAWIFLVNLFKK